MVVIWRLWHRKPLYNGHYTITNKLVNGHVSRYMWFFLIIILQNMYITDKQMWSLYGGYFKQHLCTVDNRSNLAFFFNIIRKQTITGRYMEVVVTRYTVYSGHPIQKWRNSAIFFNCCVRHWEGHVNHFKLNDNWIKVKWKAQLFLSWHRLADYNCTARNLQRPDVMCPQFLIE